MKNTNDILNKKFDELWDKELQNAEAENNDGSFDKIRQKIRTEKRKTLPFREILKIAAIIIPILGIIFYYTQNHEKTYTISNVNPNLNAQNISLSDYSTIQLFPQSSLLYNENFNIKNRSVIFDGSATFNISKNKNIPFIIKYENLEIKVLGTEFNILRDEKNGWLSIKLFSGKIEILENDKILKTLFPNMIFNYDYINHKELNLSDESSLFSEILNDKKNRNISIKFKNEDIRNAYISAGEKIGFQIDFSQVQIPNNTFVSLSFDNQNITEILQQLNRFSKVKHHFKGNEIVLSEK